MEWVTFLGRTGSFFRRNQHPPLPKHYDAETSDCAALFQNSPDVAVGPTVCENGRAELIRADFGSRGDGYETSCDIGTSYDWGIGY